MSFLIIPVLLIICKLHSASMKKLLLACFTIVPFLCFSQTANKAYRLVWQDEFNYTGHPDSSKWVEETGGDGWGNHELQYYTSGNLGNARVGNGVLTIQAKKEPYKSNKYTSAKLITRGKQEWNYGRIEVKAKLPKGRGTWPAIWMLAANKPLKWPDDGEIDIMEHVGFNPGYVHGSVHCKKYYHVIGTQKTDTTIVPDFSDAFHVYSMQWNKDSLTVGIDGKDFFKFANEHSGYDAWPFDNKFYLILNIAVGGDWGGAKGVDDEIFPQKMEIDYVRVYQEN
jgi:beta-glucanase (GH16 family)